MLTTGLLLSCLASLVLGLEPPLEESAEENGLRPPRPGGLITKFNSVLCGCRSAGPVTLQNRVKDYQCLGQDPKHSC
jgi:hypothetical protein